MRITLLFLILLLVPIVSAIDMEIDNEYTTCYPNGQIRAEMEIEVSEDDEDYNFRCSRLNSYDYSNKSLDVEFDCYIDEKKQHSKEIESGSKETVVLISKEGRFDESRRYKIKVELDSKSDYVEIKCSKIKYSCEDLNLKTNCIDKGSYFEAIVSELGISVWLIVLMIFWSSVWKLLALWKSARNNHLIWFVAIAVLNTLGILPILYIFIFSKLDKKSKKKAKTKPKKRKSKKKK